MFRHRVCIAGEFDTAGLYVVFGGYAMHSTDASPRHWDGIRFGSELDSLVDAITLASRPD